MTKTIKLTEIRRDVLLNALSAEIESLAEIVYSEQESPEDKARYGEQLKTAKDLMKKVRHD